MFEKDKESFPGKEEKILDFWEKNEIFKKSIENRKNNKIFSFYDGPPFATGLPHYGHLLTSTIKDVVARYKTMKGYYVPRRFGWDCHGLPVENEIEKSHNLSTATAIEEYGIGKFNEDCRAIVQRYTQEWKKTILRIGRWVEFDKTYLTMDLFFMESVWWVFGKLWSLGLIYEGFKVMHYSPRLGTPISNFEANLNYKTVDDPSLIVKFKLIDDDAYMLVWTTTPWTLPSNLALAIGKCITYVRLRSVENGEIYILAENQLNKYFKEGEYELISVFLGDQMIGRSYEPIFQYFTNHKGAFHILDGDFVNTDDGTGIVHIAPAFGEDDFFLCKKANIDIVCPIDKHCNFTDEVSEFKGLFVKDADKAIIRTLKNDGKVFKSSTLSHRYPFCWRTDVPLIYRAVSTWFVSVEKIKDKIITNNELINWVPNHIKNGRFGKWLENARDWAISRNRYWGTPLPVWRSECGDILIISSITQLEKMTGEKIQDLHRHFIDHLQIESNGKIYKRVDEVFDCWFESGSMPYGQNHYPFENKEDTLKNFPADFIAEGLDQTRGWFYTLNVLSTALFNKPAFKNVIVNGIVLAEDGQKMSKRLKNYPEPTNVIDKYGSDAIRLYFLNSQVVHGDDISFSENGVDGVLKKILIPLWNSYVFLSTYAKIYSWIPLKKSFAQPSADIDRWALSLLQSLMKDVENGMNLYRLDRAVEPFIEFIDNITNWYIRRNRSRFWSDNDNSDRREAFETLYVVLITLSKISAPFIPFISETIYQELKIDSDEISVHLCNFPIENKDAIDLQLEKEMKYTKVVVNIGHSLRKEHHIKVRQPLAHAYIACDDNDILLSLRSQQDLIKDELNVKDITFNLDEFKFIKYKPKPNYKVLGKRVGKLMDKVRVEIELLDQSILYAMKMGETINIVVGEEVISLSEEDVLIEREVKENLIALSSNNITFVLDTNITPELEKEGIAREIVNKINSIRKNNCYEITDRIIISIDTTDKVRESIILFVDYIQGEVLAKNINFEKCQNGEEIDINGNISTIQIIKI